jgi:Xaa-Pro aminopeptidase
VALVVVLIILSDQRITTLHSRPAWLFPTVIILSCPISTGHPNLVHPEPGFYADGRFGIRIESIVVVQDAQTPNNFNDKGYLRFEHVTMVGSTLIVVHVFVADCKLPAWLASARFTRNL